MNKHKSILLTLIFFVITSLGGSLCAFAGSHNSAKGSNQGIGKQGSQMDSDWRQGGYKHDESTNKKQANNEKKKSKQQFRHQLQDEEIYGRQMMSMEERERYRKRLYETESNQEWAKLRAEHQQEMQARAAAQGRQLRPPIYGEHMISLQERNQYTDKMNRANSDAERNQIRREHKAMIKQRAQELGIDLPPEE